MSKKQRVYTAKGAADYLGISYSYFMVNYRPMINKIGRCGKKILFKEDDILRLKERMNEKINENFEIIA